MAIQMRRGNAVDFNPSAMLPGEWAVCQNNEKLYMCFSPGRVIEVGSAGTIIPYVQEAEAWANGEKDGEPVPVDDEQYNNNSKYYSGQARNYSNMAKTYMESASYIFIKYSEYEDGHDFVDVPDEHTIYIGVYEGNSSTAPTQETEYDWFLWKGAQGEQGEKGDTGNTGAYVFRTEQEWQEFDKTVLVDGDVILFLFDRTDVGVAYMLQEDYVGSGATQSVHNADNLGGHNSTYYMARSEFVGSSASTAVRNSERLGGNQPTYYAQSSKVDSWFGDPVTTIDGQTVTFTGIDTNKSYSLFAEDLLVSPTKMELTNEDPATHTADLTYTVKGAVVGSVFKLRQVNN